MATRYWVGGTGTWSTLSTTNWATTSGGSGGASAPTSSDDVVFDGNSGTGNVTCNGGNCAGFTYSSAALVTFSGYIFVYTTFFTNRPATTALSALQVILYGTSISMAVDSYVQELDIQTAGAPYTATASGNIYAKYLNVNTGWTLNLNGRFAKVNRLYLYGTIQNGDMYFSALNSSYYLFQSEGTWANTNVYVETGTYPAVLSSNLPAGGTGGEVGNFIITATSLVSFDTYFYVKNLTVSSGGTLQATSSYRSMYIYGDFYLATGATLQALSSSGLVYVYFNKVAGSPTVTKTLRVDGTLDSTLGSGGGIYFYINSGSDTVNVPGSGFGSNTYPAGGITVQSTANFSCSTIYSYGINIASFVACDISALTSVNVNNFSNYSVGLVPGNCAINIYNYGGIGNGTVRSFGVTLAAVTVVDAIPARIRDNTTFGNLTCASSLGQGSTKGLEFEPGSTQTVTGNFVLSGASASDRVNLTIRGSGSAATITKASGTVTASYANISYSNATGGAIFKAPLTTNIDGGNNTGWIFGIPGGGNFFSFF